MLQRLNVSREGVALIEFAIVLPVLLLLLIGGAETARYLLFREKLESSATQLLSIVNQSNNVNKASLDRLYGALPALMKPYSSDSLRVVVTSISNPASGQTNCRAVAAWQYPEGGSRIAPTVGGPVDTKTIDLLGGDNVMTVEVFASYKPLTDSSITRSILGQNPTLYAYTYQHTRYGEFNLDPVTQTAIKYAGNDSNASCVQLARSAIRPTGSPATPVPPPPSPTPAPPSSADNYYQSKINAIGAARNGLYGGYDAANSAAADLIAIARNGSSFPGGDEACSSCSESIKRQAVLAAAYDYTPAFGILRGTTETEATAQESINLLRQIVGLSKEITINGIYYDQSTTDVATAHLNEAVANFQTRFGHPPQ